MKIRQALKIISKVDETYDHWGNPHPWNWKSYKEAERIFNRKWGRNSKKIVDACRGMDK